MKDVILCLISGLVVGILFKALKLPVPVPPSLAGVSGIIGLFLGLKLVDYILLFFNK